MAEEATQGRAAAQLPSLSEFEPFTAAENLPALLNAGPARQILALLTDRAPPFWLATSADDIVFSNRAYQSLAGHRLLPNQRAAVGQVLATQAAIAIDDSLDINGEPRHFRTHVYPVPDRASGPGAVAGLMFDATKEIAAFGQVKIERQRFHDVIRSSADWVWETDREGVLTFVSDRVTEAMGVPAAMLCGRRFADLSEEPMPEQEMTQPENPRPFRDASFRIAGGGGETRHFSLSGVPVFDDRGGFSGYRGTATDITGKLSAEAALREHQAKLELTLDELKLNNLELEAALKQARAAFESKNEFLATMSHELRTPLNAIIGFSEVISAGIFGAIDQRYKSYVSDITSAGQQLLGMVENVLSLAEAKNAALELKLESAAIGPILVEALAKIESRAAEKGVRLVAPPAPDALPPVKVDVARAAQILVELLGNAVKFTSAGGSVGVLVAKPADAGIEIAVWDTGPGIPADKQALIFDSFQQVHTSIYARGFEGIGAGLALARELARAMGGEVSLEASSAQGSRFSVRFPLA